MEGRQGAGGQARLNSMPRLRDFLPSALAEGQDNVVSHNIYVIATSCIYPNCLHLLLLISAYHSCQTVNFQSGSMELFINYLIPNLNQRLI